MITTEGRGKVEQYFDGVEPVSLFTMKNGLLLAYILSAISYVSGGPLPFSAETIQRVFFVLMGIHLLEFIVKFKLLRGDSSMGLLGHFVCTMIYGLFHWRPIQQALKKKVTE